MASASQKAETAVEEIIEDAEKSVRKAASTGVEKLEKGLDKAAEVAHNVTDKAVSGAEAAIEGTRKATSKSLDKAEKAIHTLQEHADPAIDELAHKALDLATKSINLAADAGERTRQKVCEISDATNRYVQEKPAKALFIAAAAGALVALLLNNRRDRY